MKDLFDDTPFHTLSRSNDPQTSKDAAAIAPTGKMRMFVYDLIKEAGIKGITTKEMTKRYRDISHSSITSRPNELEKLGLVVYLGDKRDGARVIRDSSYKNSTMEIT